MLWWSFPQQINRELLSPAIFYKADKLIIICELERVSLFNKLNLNPVTLAGWKKWKDDGGRENSEMDLSSIL